MRGILLQNILNTLFFREPHQLQYKTHGSFTDRSAGESHKRCAYIILRSSGAYKMYTVPPIKFLGNHHPHFKLELYNI